MEMKKCLTCQTENQEKVRLSNDFHIFKYLALELNEKTNSLL